MYQDIRLAVLAIILLTSGCATQTSTQPKPLFQFDQTKMQARAWQKLLHTYGNTVLNSRITDIYYPGQIYDKSPKEDSLDRILFVFIHPFDLKLSIDEKNFVSMTYDHITFTVALDPYGNVLSHTMSNKTTTHLKTNNYDSVPEFLKETNEVKAAFKVSGNL